MSDKKSYRVDEVANAWDVSRDTVERLIKKREIDAFKVGDTWRIKQEEITDFEKRNRPARK